MRENRNSRELRQFIDREKFDDLAVKWQIDRWVRELPTWKLTCALLTQMTHRLGSYREIQQVLDIPKSTLADALTRRSYGFFEELNEVILGQLQILTSDRKIKRGIREILALDSTECRVHGSLHKMPGWLSRKADGRQAMVKLHTVWNVDGSWINDYIITGARKHDSPVGHRFNLKPNKTYVFDRGYSDIAFWLKIKRAGTHFVTRLKDYSVVNRNVISEDDGVLFEGEYRPNPNSLYKKRFPRKCRADAIFRYVVYRDPKSKRVLYLLTSDFESPAQYIADVYKARWAVELLYRWMKGHLNIRYMDLRSTNAVRVQLAIAVLVQLLLQIKKLKESFTGTLWDLLRKMRTDVIRQTLRRRHSRAKPRREPAATNRSEVCVV